MNLQMYPANFQISQVFFNARYICIHKQNLPATYKLSTRDAISSFMT